LDWTHFVDNVEMISVVDSLVECACKLLSWMHEGLKLYIGHLKGLGQHIRLVLQHVESRLDHILLKLVVHNFYFASCMVI